MKTSSRSKKDPIKAELLLRLQQQKKTYEELARVLGVSRQTMYRMIERHTDDWSLWQVKKALWYVHVTKDEYKNLIGGFP